MFQREDALDLSRRPERGTRAGVGEDVVLIRADIGAGIKHPVREADSGATGHAAGPPALERDRGQRAVASGPDLEPLQAVRPIASRDMLFTAVQHQPHRRASLPRQMDRQQAEVADAVLRTESAAREVADHADAILRQLEQLGGLVAHAGRELRRGINREPFIRPVGHQTVGFHRDVRLHLGAVLGVDHDVGFRERLCDVASRQPEHRPCVRATHIPFLRQTRRCTAATGGRGLLGRPGEHGRRVLAHSIVQSADVTEHVITDDHQGRGLLGGAL